MSPPPMISINTVAPIASEFSNDPVAAIPPGLPVCVLCLCSLAVADTVIICWQLSFIVLIPPELSVSTAEALYVPGLL